MIKQENITIKKKKFVKTYSTENKYIRQIETNNIYQEAIDITPLQYTYEETNEKIEE